MEVPILVLEFVPKSSLYDVLHSGNGRTHLLSLLELQDIAIGSAEALSYMHSRAKHHVYGDVKTANILLNNDVRSKIPPPPRLKEYD
jgi:serine/threonine protein kinase